LFKNSYSWSANGDFLAFEQPDPISGWDVWVLPVRGDRKPRAVARTRANEGGGWFSPDGSWIAYYSDESGRNEIYVQSFPQARGRSLVSGSATSGTVGTGPCWWSQDGRELMLRVGATIKVASVQPGETLHIGASRKLFDLPPDVGEVYPTPDLQRLLATVSLAASTTPAIVIDLNWMAALAEE
jgi:Tol biopolymer transport system component